MAEETGGHVFPRRPEADASCKMPSPSFRTRCAANMHRLPAPPTAIRTGTFRRIEIKTNNKDWKVQARKGYYASHVIRPEPRVAQTFEIRPATIVDVEAITAHRRAMFFEMGYRDEAVLDAMIAAFRPWLRRKMVRRRVSGMAGRPSGRVRCGRLGAVVNGLASAHGRAGVAARKYSECLHRCGLPAAGVGTPTDGGGAGLVPRTPDSRGDTAFE